MGKQENINYTTKLKWNSFLQYSLKKLFLKHFRKMEDVLHSSS